MSQILTLTGTAQQVTDGSNNAHVTGQGASVLYADSQDSEAWHYAELGSKTLTISAPAAIWMKSASSTPVDVTVTTY